MITITDIVEKRKARWAERCDIRYDAMLVSAAIDKILDSEQLRAQIYARPYLLIEVAFTIVDKDGQTVPFFLNEVQNDFIGRLESEGTKRPFFVLKGRQQGFTSLITAIQLSYALVRKNFSGFTLADKSSNATAIFNNKAKTVYDRLPERLKPHEKFNSKKEMFFDRLNSSWNVDTATEHVGRSRTLSFLHLSEVAFYECSLATLQAAVNPALVKDAIVVYETTANGFNEAKDVWDSGACVNLFYEWYRSSEYVSEEYEYLEYQDGWLEERKRLLLSIGLSKEQITWYCKTYKKLVDKSLMRQEFPCTPEEAFVATGYSIFDTEKITARLMSISKLPKYRLGYFEYEKISEQIFDEDGSFAGTRHRIENIIFRDSPDGYIRLHEEPLFERDSDGVITSHAPYVLGADTAGRGDDYFTAKVICNLDGRTVATLQKQRIDEDIFAEQVYCLGRYYNDAFVGIEINYSMHPTRVLAKKYEYPNLYMRKVFDTNTERYENEYGFNTTPRTRPTILAELVEIMRDNISLEPDRKTLGEMLTFVTKDNGRKEAIDGEHDDLVMALAIAHNISKDYTHSYIPVKPVVDSFIEDNFNIEGARAEGGLWEDY